MKKAASVATRLFCLAVTLLLAVSGIGFAGQTLQADVVVIGAGTAGLSAALTAAQGGAAVILLEKGPGGRRHRELRGRVVRGRVEAAKRAVDRADPGPGFHGGDERDPVGDQRAADPAVPRRVRRDHRLADGAGRGVRGSLQKQLEQQPHVAPGQGRTPWCPPDPGAVRKDQGEPEGHGSDGGRRARS